MSSMTATTVDASMLFFVVVSSGITAQSSTTT
jgi:hypothetical protein